MTLRWPWPLLIFLLAGMSGCAELDDILGSDSGPEVIYVKDSSRPRRYDPFYEQQKVVYVVPQQLHETTKTKTKNGKVYKTTTIKDQFGDVVYEHTTSKKKKKK